MIKKMGVLAFIFSVWISMVIPGILIAQEVPSPPCAGCGGVPTTPKPFMVIPPSPLVSPTIPNALEYDGTNLWLTGKNGTRGSVFSGNAPANLNNTVTFGSSGVLDFNTGSVINFADGSVWKSTGLVFGSGTALSFPDGSAWGSSGLSIPNTAPIPDVPFRTAINIKNYGCSPSLSDNTTCLQNAVNAAGSNGNSVYIPSGTYTVLGTVTLPNASLQIFGDGPTSILSFTSANNGIVIDNLNQVVLKHFTLDESGSGIALDISLSTANESFTHKGMTVLLDGMIVNILSGATSPEAVYISNLADVYIVNSIFQNYSTSITGNYNGFSFLNFENYSVNDVISNDEFIDSSSTNYGTLTTGIYLNGNNVQGITIDNCHFLGGWMALYSINNDSVFFTNNIADYNQTEIVVSGGFDVNITGNYFGNAATANAILWVNSGSHFVNIQQNEFSFYNSSETSQGLSIGSSSTDTNSNIFLSYNSFSMQGSTAPYLTNGTVDNFIIRGNANGNNPLGDSWNLPSGGIISNGNSTWFQVGNLIENFLTNVSVSLPASGSVTYSWTFGKAFPNTPVPNIQCTIASTNSGTNIGIIGSGASSGTGTTITITNTSSTAMTLPFSCTAFGN